MRIRVVGDNTVLQMLVFLTVIYALLWLLSSYY